MEFGQSVWKGMTGIIMAVICYGGRVGPIRLINLCSVINIEEADPSGKESSDKFVQSGDKWELNGFLCVLG